MLKMKGLHHTLASHCQTFGLTWKQSQSAEIAQCHYLAKYTTVYWSCPLTLHVDATSISYMVSSEDWSSFAGIMSPADDFNPVPF